MNFRKKYLGIEEHTPIYLPEVFTNLNWTDEEYFIKKSAFQQPNLTTCRGCVNMINRLGDHLAQFHQSMLDLGVNAIFLFPKTDYIVDNQFSDPE